LSTPEALILLFGAKLPNLELKTRPKQLLGCLLLPPLSNTCGQGEEPTLRAESLRKGLKPACFGTELIAAVKTLLSTPQVVKRCDLMPPQPNHIYGDNFFEFLRLMESKNSPQIFEKSEKERKKKVCL
jgi:hypothetical protein